MKIIHNNGFSDDDRDAYKNIIRRNTLQSMQTLIETCACFEAQLLHPVNKVGNVGNICAIQVHEDVQLSDLVCPAPISMHRCIGSS